MRLLQKAAEKATPGGHSSSSWAESQSEHRGGSAGFEGAPWMGHGGVHHPDAGHIGRFAAYFSSTACGFWCAKTCSCKLSYHGGHR